MTEELFEAPAPLSVALTLKNDLKPAIHTTRSDNVGGATPRPRSLKGAFIFTRSLFHTGIFDLQRQLEPLGVEAGSNLL
jgi:hypothetical protein